MLRAAVSRSVTLNLRLADRLPSVQVDAGQVLQAVMSLVINASEAIGEAVGEVIVATAEQACDAACLDGSRLEEKPAPGKFVYLEVSDTGCGMDAVTLERLFDPFFTTKFTGRGLGMSAVHGILRGHQGAILVDSRVGAGTQVRLLLPVATTASATPTARDARSGTVLVVEAEDSVQHLMVAVLQRFGYTTLGARSSAEAVRFLDEQDADIGCVIMDMTAPGSGAVAAGFELCRLRPDLKVILSSGYDEAEARQQCAGVPLAGFIQKPFQLAHLREVVERVLAAGGGNTCD